MKLNQILQNHQYKISVGVDVPTPRNPEVVSLVVVVVAKVELPATAKVPLDTNDEVAVIFPPVNVLKVAVMAFIKVVKKLDEVALVLIKLVSVALEE